MAAIVQQVTGSVTGSYGIGTTDIVSATGNALVAFIGWNCVTSGDFVNVPAASVSDSTGNLWKQIGISRGGVGIASSTRCAVWATVNAQSVNWVSIGIAGYSASAAWTIAEISGLPQDIALDYSVSVNSGGTAATLSGLASGADIGFALFAPGSSGQTITGPAGWTALTSRVAATGSAPTSMTVYPYWNTGVTAGTVTTAAAFGTTSSYSVVQCGISASASPPAQYSVDFPLFTVEAAFGATPGNVSSSLEYTFSSEYITWTDISTRVIGDAVEGRVTASRGREYELQQEEAGTMTVYLDNHDGAFTPTNINSPYYSNALNPNMTFQQGPTGWVTSSGTISSSTAVTFASGLNATALYSLELLPDGVSLEPTVTNVVPVPVTVNVASYSFSCWVNCPSGLSDGAIIQVYWLNSIGGTISNVIGGESGPLLPKAWTPMQFTGAPPPAGAVSVRFGVEVGVTPPSLPFYIAELAVAPGASAVGTGLVALETPVRISCWWEGRQYPLWTGYAERWPQMWPDMPQWGFSQITATDALAVAAANSMYSALIGEVLIDNPYAYLPCNEQYTVQTVGATVANPFFFAGSPSLTPVDANGQTALNKAAGNQAVGVYFDGNNQQVSTGLSINFLGDDGTGMGATGYSGEVSGQAGPSMQYTDPGLPQIATNTISGFTVEFWFSYDGTQSIELLTGFGLPSTFTVNGADLPNGASLLASIASGTLSVQAGSIQVGTPFTPSNSPQQCVITVGSGNTPTISGWLNGAYFGSLTAANNLQVYTLVLGPGRYSYDCQLNQFTPFYNAYNYTAGHLAVYAYVLPAGRIAAHYQAGAAGWSGVTAAVRFAQVLDWAQLGLRRGGYLKSSATGVAEITQIGPAYQLNGSTASDAVNAIAQSEGGTYYVKADGTITYLERVIGYNQSAQATLGDNATSATAFLNSNPYLSGASGWSADNCTLAASSAETYMGFGSLFLTPNGSSTTVSANAGAVPVTAGSSCTAGAWVWSSTGYASVIIGFNLSLNGSFVSSSTPSFSVPAESWVYITTTVACPASGVNQFTLRVGETSTPAAGNTLYIAFAAMWESSPEVPYEKETEFDFDNTYLYNEVTATQQSGPNQLTVYDDRNLASEQEYFRRSALTFTSDVVSPYDVSDVTTWSIATFAQPSIHVTAVKVHVSANPLIAFPVALGVDIGDIVQVNRRPIGGAVISELGIVEKITYDIGARYFYVTYQLSPYQPANQVLCADTSGYDDPGVNTQLILGW